MNKNAENAEFSSHQKVAGIRTFEKAVFKTAYLKMFASDRDYHIGDLTCNRDKQVIFF